MCHKFIKISVSCLLLAISGCAGSGSSSYLPKSMETTGGEVLVVTTPPYPKRNAKSKISGQINLVVLFDAKGRASKVIFVSGDKEFLSQEVLNTVKSWKIAPVFHKKDFPRREPLSNTGREFQIFFDGKTKNASVKY